MPLFIKFLPDKRKGGHGVLINKREFKLKDIETWKVFLKVVLNYIHLSCEVSELEVSNFLKETIDEANKGYPKFKENIGWVLIGWEKYFKKEV